MLSGAYISSQLDRSLYDVIHFFIDKRGQWSLWHDSFPEKNNTRQYLTEEVINQDVLKSLIDCHLLFPVLHGPHGEDGTIQGFFEMIGKPYVGCDHRSSAICMDKALTKQLCSNAGISISPYISFNLEEWRANRELLFFEACQKLTFPMYVKAAHLGSSIGVYRVEDSGALYDAIDKVFKLDNKVVVEEGVVGRELEFAVMGMAQITSTGPGEIFSNGVTYDYEAKYGSNSFKTTVQAEGLSDEKVKELKLLAVKCYKAVGCQGLARVDFFLDDKGELLLNEINPIPGFTSISLYPKMCEAAGFSVPSVLDKLIAIGLYRQRQKNRQFISNVFSV